MFSGNPILSLQPEEADPPASLKHSACPFSMAQITFRFPWQFLQQIVFSKDGCDNVSHPTFFYNVTSPPPIKKWRLIPFSLKIWSEYDAACLQV